MCASRERSVQIAQQTMNVMNDDNPELNDCVPPLQGVILSGINSLIQKDSGRLNSPGYSLTESQKNNIINIKLLN